MKQIVLSNFDMPLIPLIGLAIFFLFFIGVLLWVYRKNSKQIFEEACVLPLQDAEGGHQ